MKYVVTRSLHQNSIPSSEQIFQYLLLQDPSSPLYQIQCWLYSTKKYGYYVYQLNIFIELLDHLESHVKFENLLNFPCLSITSYLILKMVLRLDENERIRDFNESSDSSRGGRLVQYGLPWKTDLLLHCLHTIFQIHSVWASLKHQAFKKTVYSRRN